MSEITTHYVLNYSSIIEEDILSYMIEKKKARANDKMRTLPLVPSIHMSIDQGKMILSTVYKGSIRLMIDKDDPYRLAKINSNYKLYKGKITIVEINEEPKVISSPSDKVINVVSNHIPFEIRKRTGMIYAESALKGVRKTTVNYYYDEKKRESGLSGIIYSMNKAGNLLVLKNIEGCEIENIYTLVERWDQVLIGKQRSKYNTTVDVTNARTKRCGEVLSIIINSQMVSFDEVIKPQNESESEVRGSIVDEIVNKSINRCKNRVEKILLKLIDNIAYSIEIVTKIIKLVFGYPQTFKASIPIKLLYVPIAMAGVYETVLEFVSLNPLAKTSIWLGNAILKKAGVSKVEIENENRRLGQDGITQTCAIRLEKSHYDEVASTMNSQYEKIIKRKIINIKLIKMVFIVITSLITKTYVNIGLYVVYLIAKMALGDFKYDECIENITLSTTTTGLIISITWMTLYDIIPKNINRFISLIINIGTIILR